MGKYINFINGKHIGTSYEQKCQAILDAGGEEISTPTEFKEDLVCVVDNNGLFAAAGYAYDEREMEHFKNHTNGRPTKWFILKDVETYVD